MIQTSRKILLMYPVLLFLLAAGATGCSSLGFGKSEPQFGTNIQSAAGKFDDRASRSAPPDRELAEMTAPEHERRGDTARSRGEMANAYFQYEKALEKDPGNHRIMHKQGVVLLAGGINDQAAAAFRSLAEEAPEYAPAHEGLGLALFRQESIDEAETAFRRAVDIDPDRWESHTYLGIIHDTRNEHELARKAYIQAIRTNPGNKTAAYNNLGVSYHRSGDYERAARVFQEAVNAGMASDRMYNNLGRALGMAGKYDQALAAFGKAGNRSQAYNNLGCIYLARGRYERAIEYFEKAISARPEYYTTAGENLRYARLAMENRFRPVQVGMEMDEPVIDAQ